MAFISVKLCATSVHLCDTISYTENHRGFTTCPDPSAIFYGVFILVNYYLNLKSNL